MSARKTEVNPSEFERATRPVLRPSVHEILSDADSAHGAFDLDDHQRDALDEQVRERSELAAYSARFIEKLPSPYMELRDAVEQNHITATEVAELYARLSEFLRDISATRLVLYLPFQWLPDRTNPSDDPTLQAAEASFAESYIDAWWSLLCDHDVRAHFDDGDMRLDIDKNPDELPHVIKAAHLLPFIIPKGLISEEDVAYIYNGTNSATLRSSIDEAMAVYRGMSQRVSEDTSRHEAEMSVSPEMIHAYHTAQLQQVYTEREAHASPQRLEWLEKVAFETTVQTMATHVDISQARDLMVTSDELLESTGCIALGNIVETTDAPDERLRAISTLLTYGSVSMKYYSMTLLRLYRGGCIDQTELDTRGIRIPLLHGELSKNLDLNDSEVNVIHRYIDAVQHDPELSTRLYPVVLVGGSRLKGYGDEHSDVDLTICVKPGVDESMREALLSRVLPLLDGDKPHEFWLEDDGTRLHIRDIETQDQFVGNDYWVHVLFGGAWVGDEIAIRELQSNIYPPYFFERYFQDTDMALQPAYLQRIEHDVLLYRLLHRGYAHQYPVPPLRMPRAELIDGNGVFYDGGYRQLATQLFIEKVFLPVVPR